MSLDAGEELNAHFLSSLGKAFEARLAEQTGVIEADLALCKDIVKKIQNELDLQKSNSSNQLSVYAETNVRLMLAQVREDLVQNIVRIDERAKLASRLSEQASTATAATSAKTTVEISHIREAIALLQTEAEAVGADQKKLAERIIAVEKMLQETVSTIGQYPSWITEARTETVQVITAMMADELSQARSEMQFATRQIAREEIAQAQAHASVAQAVRDETLSYLDERVTNALRAMGRASATADEMAGERDRIQADLVAFKDEFLANIAADRTRSEQLFLTAVGEAHAKAARLIGNTVSEMAPCPPNPTENQAASTACLTWLVNHGETALNDASGAFDITAGLAWSDEIYIDAAYRWLLERPVEPKGMEHQLLQLRSGTCRRQLLLDIARSIEARNRLHYGLSWEGDDRTFLYTAYTRLLGRSTDGGGQEHYLAILKRKGGNGRGTILHDIAHSREAYLNRTAQASAWRFIARANSRSMRWRETWRRLCPGGRAAQRYAWQAGRLAALESGLYRTSEHTRQHLDAFRREILDFIVSLRSTEHQQIVAALSASHADASNDATPPIQGVTPAMRRSAPPPPPGPSLSLKMLLSDSSAERQVPHIAQAIRAELKKLGIN